MSKKNQVIVTPIGTAIFPCLNVAEYYDETADRYVKDPQETHDKSKYKTSLQVPAAEAADLIAQIDTAAEELKAELKAKKKGKPVELKPLPYYQDEETGDYIFTMNVDSHGQYGSRKPAIADSAGKDTDVNIGGGSKIRLRCNLKKYSVGSNNGVRLEILAVQVIELKTFGGAGAGFDAVDGGYVDDGQAAKYDNQMDSSQEGEEEDDTPW